MSVENINIDTHWVIVKIKNNITGEVRTIEPLQTYVNSNTKLPFYWSSDGNGGCDCSRFHYFNNNFNDDIDCSEGLFSANVYLQSTGKCIQKEFMLEDYIESLPEQRQNIIIKHRNNVECLSFWDIYEKGLNSKDLSVEEQKQMICEARKQLNEHLRNKRVSINEPNWIFKDNPSIRALVNNRDENSKKFEYNIYATHELKKM